MLDKIQSNCLKIVQEKFLFSFKIYCLFTLWPKKQIRISSSTTIHILHLCSFCVCDFLVHCENPLLDSQLFDPDFPSRFLQKNPLSRRKKSTRNVPRDWPFEMSISSMEMSFLFFSSLYIRVRQEFYISQYRKNSKYVPLVILSFGLRT